MPATRRMMLGGLLACSVLPDSARAAPDSAKLWLNRWLTAFNHPNLTVYARFIRENVPDVAPYIDEDLGVREASGGFLLLGYERTADGLTAIVKDRWWDRQSRVLLSLNNRGIQDVSFRQAPDRPTRRPRLNDPDAMQALGNRLEREVAAGRFSGTVAVSRGAKSLFRKAYGARVADGSDPIASTTRFCVGSVGKIFTAVGILRLIQDKRLTLDDTIATLLPDYPDTTLAKTVRVRHLLSHTGGTGDFMGPTLDKRAAELKTLSDYIKVFGERESTAKPGTTWSYSNFGYIILGVVIEQRSGQRWDEYLRAAVFDRAGMSNTSPYATEEGSAVPLVGAHATGLKGLPPYVGLPAGGGYSTIDDLVRFARGIEQGELLDEDHRDLLRTPVIDAGGAKWGLGSRITLNAGTLCYGHRGSSPGCNADLLICPGSGHTIAVLSNRGFPHAQNVASYAATRLRMGA